MIDPTTKNQPKPDNYFSSYLLAKPLLKSGITFLGTLRKHKKEIPPDFVVVYRDTVPGHYMFTCQDDKTLVSLVIKKKRTMLVLTTMHNWDVVNQETGKPEPKNSTSL